MTYMKRNAKQNALQNVTLTVTTTTGLGTRTMIWYGPSARKTADHWKRVWEQAGHTVTEG